MPTWRILINFCRMKERTSCIWFCVSGFLIWWWVVTKISGNDGGIRKPVRLLLQKPRVDIGLTVGIKKGEMIKWYAIEQKFFWAWQVSERKNKMIHKSFEVELLDSWWSGDNVGKSEEELTIVTAEWQVHSEPVEFLVPESGWNLTRWQERWG